MEEVMDDDQDKITRLFSIRRTLIQMLKDRNYLVGDFEMTEEQFIEKKGKDMIRTENGVIISKAKSDHSSDDQVYVFFSKIERVRIKKIKEYFTLMMSNKVFRAIIVIQSKLSKSARTGLTEILESSPTFHVEIFQESELLVNITEQVLVPKHQVLTDEEKKAVLERYHAKESQLPQIRRTDPIARYYGLKRGQVVKIFRISETEGQYVTYRCAK